MSLAQARKVVIMDSTSEVSRLEMSMSCAIKKISKFRWGANVPTSQPTSANCKKEGSDFLAKLG
jgi:hypothetical protein